jgi:hypothetical protein
LQAIQKVEKYDFAYNLKNITREIIKTLITDKGLFKADATDKLYNSELFTQLSDKTTKFYEKDWTEIYKLVIHNKQVTL